MSDPVPVLISDLKLDEENPRLVTPNQGQHRTIRSLAASQGARLQALATDIVQYGLDPSDLFVVMESEDAGYTVLDGNRRVTALKVLENPEIVKDAVSNEVLRALKRLSRKYELWNIDAVLCIVVNDRSEADHWIELRHTGYHGGAGPERWGPDEGARFRARTGGFKDAETQALNFLQQRGYIDSEFRSKVPTSTYRRLLRTPGVREKLGVDWQDNTLLVTGDEDAVAKALLHVAKDLSTRRVTSRDLGLSEDRIRYAESIPPEIVVDQSATQPGQRADTSKERQSSSSTLPRRRTRDQLIPSSFVLNVTDDRIRDIETELRKLSLQQYPNAVSVLFRVFLELSVDAYIERVGILKVNEGDNLGHKLRLATQDLVDKKKLTFQKAKVVRRAAQRDGYLGPSITGMNQYVHNKHLFPGPSDLRADWDSLQPWFGAVWYS